MSVEAALTSPMLVEDGLDSPLMLVEECSITNSRCSWSDLSTNIQTSKRHNFWVKGRLQCGIVCLAVAVNFIFLSKTRCHRGLSSCRDSRWLLYATAQIAHVCHLPFLCQDKVVNCQTLLTCSGAVITVRIGSLIGTAR